MVKYFKNLFLSMQSAIILFLVFAIVSAIATFVESDFGTQTAWAMIYGTLWFGIIQLLLGINLAYNIFRYKLYKKNKIHAFIFHVGFLFILLGAGVTRYIGYEGIMHIRDGQSENRIISSAPYIQVDAVKGNKIYHVDKKAYLSKISDNYFDLDMNIGAKKAEIKYLKFIPNATSSIVYASDGKPMISFMSTDPENSNFILKDKSKKDIGNIILTLNGVKLKSSNSIWSSPKVNITTNNGGFYITSNKDITVFNMATQGKNILKAGKQYKFISKRLYTIDKVSFAPKSMNIKGKEELVSGGKTRAGMKFRGFDAVVVQVKYNGDTKKVTMFGQGKGAKGFTKHETIGGVPFSFEWGSKIITLPFYVKLRKFILNRYPGSMSPSSYASEVTLIDKKNGVDRPFRIYMNHVLDYKNYRFFQSSYDRDEKGTILSVNHDPGKYPTYFGYLLLAIGFILTILSPKSRFRTLGRKIQQEMKKSKNAIGAVMIAAFLSALFYAPQPLQAQTKLTLQESINIAKKYEKKHADEFGHLLVQNKEGRIEPIDSFANNVLDKVSRKRSFYGLDADQIILGMLSAPRIWQNIPMIKISHSKIKRILGLKQSTQYASFKEFFNYGAKNPYKLSTYAEVASRKPPIDRNMFDKDVLRVDERLNVLYYVYTGSLFRIFPKIGDPTNKWYAPKTAISTFPKAQSTKIRTLLANYFESLNKGVKTGNWQSADSALKAISNYQQKYGAKVIENTSHVKAEILYNRLNIFTRLIPVYLISGLLLLFVVMFKMLKPKSSVKWFERALFIVILLAFLAQVFNMGLRWYVAGHAPWSDGYESMIYISFALMLAGLVFSKHSTMALSLTAILTGVFLFVAHLSWMDPQITNLVPVLKSYWLMIHVSVITASYGFLGLNMLLGMFTLIMYIMLSSDPKNKRNESIINGITEATRVNEMSMILGLMLLTMGNFLGGVWANESWGRYWSWDPKETWALVSILVYAAVVHMRFVPRLNGQFAFAVASTVAYFSIIMTYLGVNYYLVGMHSYASGQPVPIPDWIYYAVAAVFIVILLAIPKRKYSKRL